MPEPQRTDRSEQSDTVGARRYTTLARSCVSTYEHLEGFSKARERTDAVATRDTLADRALNRRINPSISYARSSFLAGDITYGIYFVNLVLAVTLGSYLYRKTGSRHVRCSSTDVVQRVFRRRVSSDWRIVSNADHWSAEIWQFPGGTFLARKENRHTLFPLYRYKRAFKEIPFCSLTSRRKRRDRHLVSSRFS